MASFVMTTNGKCRALVFKKGIRDTKVCNTKTEAKEWAAQRETEIKLHAGDPDQIKEVTLAKAFERYSTDVSPSKKGCKWEQIRLAAIAKRSPWFVEKAMAKITNVDIAKWRDESLKRTVAVFDGPPKKIAEASVRREWNLLFSVFEIARKEWNWSGLNPMTDVAKPKNSSSRSRDISVDEIRAILAALQYVPGTEPRNVSGRVALAFLVALQTGMRAGELMALTPKDVDFAKETAILTQTKNGDRRLVPLSSKAIELLKLLPTDGRTLFNITSASLDVLFRRATRAAGLVNITFHDTRHVALTSLSKRLDAIELAATVGHRDLRSIMTYYLPSMSDLADKLNRKAPVV